LNKDEIKQYKKVYYQNNKSTYRANQFKHQKKKLLQKEIDKNNKKEKIELGLTIYFD